MIRSIVILLTIFSSIEAYASPGDITFYKNDGKNERDPVYILTKNEFNELPHDRIVTMTPWTEKNISTEFSGVTIRNLLKYVGLNGVELKFHALNDYEITVPMEDVERYNILLADKKNGKELSVRDFGPYFIIYPLDENRDVLNTPKYLSRFIWQVDEITVVK